MNGGTNIDVFVNSKEVTSKNYYESNYANVHVSTYESWWQRYYSLPEITLRLANAGDKISSTNKVTFSYSYAGGKIDSVDFTANNSSKNLAVGELSSNEKSYSEIGGSVVVDSVAMTYGGKTFNVKLTTPITIRQVTEAPPTLTYTVPSEYSSIFASLPAKYTSYDGKNRVVLADLADVILRDDIANDEESVATTPIAGAPSYFYKLEYTEYTKQSLTATQGYDYYSKFEKISSVWTVTSVVDTYNVYYKFNGWKVDGQVKDASSTIDITESRTIEADILYEHGRDLGEKPSTERKQNTYTSHSYYYQGIHQDYFSKGFINWGDKKEPPSGYTETDDSTIPDYGYPDVVEYTITPPDETGWIPIGN